MLRFLIVGGGGRESAFARKLSSDSVVYAVMPHENSSIIECVKDTGGAYVIGEPSDLGTVADFAVKSSIDYAFINSDEPLANGVVDELLSRGIKAVGGTRDASRIEWDKVYGIELVHRTSPEFTPFFIIVRDHKDIKDAMFQFKSRGLHVVVKPQGLTGGKGVKVMPEHLGTYEDCELYASSLIDKNPGHGVLLVEKLDGIEFTIMGITDGSNLVLSPASYDYPFRYEDDRGAGTGGMGCFTGPGGRLPFMTDDDLEACKTIMQRTIDDMRGRGTVFNGVINGGFFKTAGGIRFMEFNSRFGDPEGINVLYLLKGSFSELVVSMWDGTVSEEKIRFDDKASVVKYVVAAEYPNHSAEAVMFTVDMERVSDMDVDVLHASCIRVGDDRYETLKRSRVMAFAALSDDIDEASSCINAAIDMHVTGSLEYRRDIGSKKSLEKMDEVTRSMMG